VGNVTSIDIDELDLQLVNALQIAPRASWATLGRILAVGAQTLASRWERLSAAGAAWVATYPGGRYHDMVTALIEVDCLPGAQAGVVATLCADPRVVTVEESAQEHDLLLTVMTADLPEMTSFVLDHLASLEGVSHRRVHLATSVFHDGSRWHLHALSREQTEQLERLPRPTQQTVRPPANAWPLIEALAVDGRRTAAQIAEVTGRKPATVRRQLPQLLHSGILSMRCEIAQPASGHPVSCTLRGRLDPAQIGRTVGALRGLPNLRLAMSTTGHANFVITVWAGELARISEIEQLLADRLPSLEIMASSVNLRTPKRVGRILDEQGYATGEVVTPTALRAR
jgi:DNA-binding Lrp family transcriptional regulator